MNNKNFYIPRLDELENYCEKTNNCPTAIVNKCKSSGNTICIDGTSPEECCGNYILNLPKAISNLNLNPLTFGGNSIYRVNPNSIINGSYLKIETTNECVLYDIVLDSTGVDSISSGIITRNCCPIFIPCKNGCIKLKFTATIIYKHDYFYIEKEKKRRIIDTLPGVQNQITTLIFDDEIILYPYKTSNGLTKEKLVYIPSVDNRGSIFIKYTYVNKDFLIDFIAVNLALDIPTSFYS